MNRDRLDRHLNGHSGPATPVLEVLKLTLFQEYSYWLLPWDNSKFYDLIDLGYMYVPRCSYAVIQ